MSLLLQALQKASKTREEPEGDVDSEAADLSLEPLAEPQLTQGKPAPARSSASQAQAAAVLRASEGPSFSAIDWAREHYMLTFLGCAILTAIGYGTYVYIQISNPGLLRATPRPVQSPLQPVAAPASIPPTQHATKISGMPAVEPAQPVAEGVLPSPAPAPSAHISESAREQTRPRATAVVRATSIRPPGEPSVARVEDDAGLETIEIPDSSPTVGVGLPRSRDDIAVRRQAGSAAVNSTLLAAYDALRAGKYADARALYNDVLRGDSRNTDALLGLAAISWKEARADEAGAYYGRVLEADPRNSFAQAGLIALMGGADPIAAESRLKQLVAREPSGFLYFTLGNLYAEQGQWPAAQQAYFQAYQLMPDNPDYAFNLAVGLEHLGQPKLALDYYRKALDLSFKQGRANFDQNLAIERVGQLSARLN